jgi:hypothetical protein
VRAVLLPLVTRGARLRRGSLLSLLASVLALGGCGKTESDDDALVVVGGSSSTSGGSGGAPGAAGSDDAVGGAGGMRFGFEGDPWAHACPEDRAATGGACVPAPAGCILGGSYLLTGSTCNLTAECAGEVVSVSCGRGKTSPWSCSCDGKKGTFEVAGVADDGSACHVALEVCPTDYLAGATCDLTEESSLAEDECDSSIECSVTREVRGLKVTATALSFGLCEREGEDWLCSCEGSDSATFKLAGNGDQESVDACSDGARVCDAFAAREPETPTGLVDGVEKGQKAQGCTIQQAEGDAESCRLTTSCYLEREQWAGLWVEPWVGVGVACERAAQGWSCDCDFVDSFRAGGAEEVPPEAAPCLEHLVAECGGAL